MAWQIRCCLAKRRKETDMDWIEIRDMLGLEIAANTEIPKNAGYINEEYYNFLPNLQLAVCYYKIGNIEKSIEHNDLAAKVNPNHSSVIYNKKFFDKMVANKKM